MITRKADPSSRTFTLIYVSHPVRSFFPLSYHFHLILAYSCIMPRLTNESTVNLRTGRKMPRLGLGSGGLRDQTAVDAVEHAMKVGYLMGEPP